MELCMCYIPSSYALIYTQELSLTANACNKYSHWSNLHSIKFFSIFSLLFSFTQLKFKCFAVSVGCCFWGEQFSTTTTTKIDCTIFRTAHFSLPNLQIEDDVWIHFVLCVKIGHCARNQSTAIELKSCNWNFQSRTNHTKTQSSNRFYWNGVHTKDQNKWENPNGVMLSARCALFIAYLFLEITRITNKKLRIMTKAIRPVRPYNFLRVSFPCVWCVCLLCVYIYVYNIFSLLFFFFFLSSLFFLVHFSPSLPKLSCYTSERWM